MEAGLAPAPQGGSGPDVLLPGSVPCSEPAQSPGCGATRHGLGGDGLRGLEIPQVFQLPDEWEVAASAGWRPHPAQGRSVGGGLSGQEAAWEQPKSMH